MRARSTLVLAASAIAVAFVFVACSESANSPGAADSLSPSFAKGGPPDKVRSVSVSPSSATVAQGATQQLTATVNPSSATATVMWSSSNSSVATVSATGLVTGVNPGSATISASAGGKTGTSAITVPSGPPPAGSEILVGAGDIAVCGSTADDATAALLEGIPGTVFTLGDNAYPSGSATDYANCYDGSWGRHKARTRPSPGNHEYNTTGATGYFGYFGSAAGPAGQGYYSYDLGSWHIIVLNSNSNCGTISCAADSAQEQWLRQDLAANTKSCTLAYWHHPRFNSGSEHGNSTAVAPFWDALYEFNAEIVLNGHEHVYERFAPQTPNAVADAARGIREFIVGTGGASHYTFGTTKPNSEVRNNTANGVLKLTLKPNGYDWQFVAASGATFTDSGSGSCH
jgi:hypothetical protein